MACATSISPAARARRRGHRGGRTLAGPVREQASVSGGRAPAPPCRWLPKGIAWAGGSGASRAVGWLSTTRR